MPSRRRPIRDTSEVEAARVAQRVDETGSMPGAPSPPASGPLAAARLHRDGSADALARAPGAQAVTLGLNIYLADDAPAPDTAAGRRLLAHELTYVVQQHKCGDRPQLFSAADRPQIASDLAAMMAVVRAMAIASSHGDTVDMDALVRRAGGHTAGWALPQPLRSDDPERMSMLTLRYLFTSRAGLVDMRHFFQLPFISWFANAGNAGMAARAFARLYALGDVSAQVAIRAAVPVTTLSGGQRTRLRFRYGQTP